ncbi:MAG TPA: hypothetical protein VFK54_04630 [Candidatus Limnocylindrales bacterium]|nr:hypothetical protein [Candidatus Limnocylindrales bacterium]
MTERWGTPRDPDALALERYRYLLRTAPPDDLERAHAEAFAQLRPEQRRMLLEGLAAEAGPAEARELDDSPEALARLATRSELRHPGTIERLFGPQRGWAGGGLGSTFAGSMLGTIAGVVVGSAIAGALFDTYGDPAAADPGATAEGDAGGGDEAAAGDGGYEDAGGGFDGGVDGGGFDLGGGDFDLGGF